MSLRGKRKEHLQCRFAPPLITLHNNYYGTHLIYMHILLVGLFDERHKNTYTFDTNIRNLINTTFFE